MDDAFVAMVWAITVTKKKKKTGLLGYDSKKKLKSYLYCQPGSHSSRLPGTVLAEQEHESIAARAAHRGNRCTK